jgi:hypothetical protein
VGGLGPSLYVVIASEVTRAALQQMIAAKAGLDVIRENRGYTWLSRFGRVILAPGMRSGAAQ